MALDDYLRFVLALAFVLGLIAVCAWLFRRYARGGGMPRRTTGGRRRLAVVEAIALDTRRKLVLVRRDDREHLIIIGQQSETVVETGIALDRDAAEPAPEPRGTGRRRGEAAHMDGDGIVRSAIQPPASPDGDGRPATSFLRLVRQSSREPS
ncbi:MAG: flagellar biosynthetic protein FliO [Alphaproteobacteria bacterium]